MQNVDCILITICAFFAMTSIVYLISWFFNDYLKAVRALVMIMIIVLYILPYMIFAGSNSLVI